MNKWRCNISQMWNICCAALPVLLLVSGFLRADNLPFNWWGEFGYDFLSNKFESGNDITEHTGLLRLNASGYIYQPWFATLEGGIGLFARNADTDSGDSSSDNITGNARLRLFPQSRFPFEAFAERMNSQTDTDLTGLVTDRTRFGFTQKYVSRDGDAMHIGYERSDQTSLYDSGTDQERREELSDLFKAGYNTAFDAHTITFDASVNTVDRMDSIDISKTSFATLRHAYRPSSAFTSEDMLTFNQNDVQVGSAHVISDITQFNSYGFWQPRASRPLRINGTIRAVTRTSEQATQEITADSMTGTLGAIYEWTPQWLLNANAGMSSFDDAGETSSSSFQSLSAIFTSLNYTPYGFDANWFGQMDLRNTDDEIQSVQEAGAQLGYNLNKRLISGGGRNLSFNASQSVNALVDTNELSSETLLTNMSLTWNRNAGSVSDMVRLSASDSRTQASGPGAEDISGDFQIVNFQASIDNKLSVSSALLANMTLQATRSSREGLNTAANNREWEPTATADITYYKNTLFSVPRLSFHSSIRFVSNTYLPVIATSADDGGRDDKQWENRIEYMIGRLQLRAISRLSEIQGNRQNYLLFQARRMLGGM